MRPSEEFCTEGRIRGFQQKTALLHFWIVEYNSNIFLFQASNISILGPWYNMIDVWYLNLCFPWTGEVGVWEMTAFWWLQRRRQYLLLFKDIETFFSLWKSQCLFCVNLSQERLRCHDGFNIQATFLLVGIIKLCICICAFISIFLFALILIHTILQEPLDAVWMRNCVQIAALASGSEKLF